MDLASFLSKERLQGYKLKDEDNLEVMTKRYIWNLELCSAFYIPLHIFEIGLRNSLNNAISKQFGPDWLTSPKILAEYEQTSIQKAITELKKRNEATTAGKIIAELHFGFWIALLHRKYINSLPQKPNHALLWPTCIKDAFPCMENRNRNLRYISVHIEKIRRFRNRVFHHEPIWKTDLPNTYKEIIDGISWLYKNYNQTFNVDRVNIVIAKNPDLKP